MCRWLRLRRIHIVGAKHVIMIFLFLDGGGEESQSIKFVAIYFYIYITEACNVCKNNFCLFLICSSILEYYLI